MWFGVEMLWQLRTAPPRSPRASRRPAVQGTLAEADLQRSMILPPTAFCVMPPTDGACLYPAGVPLVHFLTAPMYLFDSVDILDKVHQPSLLPLGQAVVQIIQIDGRDDRGPDARQDPIRMMPAA